MTYGVTREGDTMRIYGSDDTGQWSVRYSYHSLDLQRLYALETAFNELHVAHPVADKITRRAMYGCAEIKEDTA